MPADPRDVETLIHIDHQTVHTIFGRLQRHEGDRRALADRLAFFLGGHGFGEEHDVYPAMADGLDGGGDAIKEAEGEHQVMKDCLATIDSSDPGTADFEEALSRLMVAVEHHVAEEESSLLPALRVAIGDEAMRELAEAFRATKRKAPTHPHPHGVSSPVLAAPLTLIDRLRDKVSDRDVRLRTDASGLLDPQVQEVIDTYAAMGYEPIELLTPDEARKQPLPSEAVKAMIDDRDLDPDPHPVADVADRTVPGPAGEIPVRVYTPLASGDGGAPPIAVYAHGGGWVLGDLDTYDSSCRAIAHRASCMVVSVDYRLAPEHPYPAAHDDVLAVTEWVMGHGRELGGDRARVAIVGESAGANMAASTCLTLTRLGRRSPSFQLLVYPVTRGVPDLGSYEEAADAVPLNTAMMVWFAAHAFADPADAIDDRFAILDAPLPDLAALSPTMVITAGRDPLRDEGEAYAARLAEAGVAVTVTRYDAMCHEFFGMDAVVDVAGQAQEQAADALRAAFSSYHVAGLP